MIIANRVGAALVAIVLGSDRLGLQTSRPERRSKSRVCLALLHDTGDALRGCDRRHTDGLSPRSPERRCELARLRGATGFIYERRAALILAGTSLKLKRSRAALADART
jgi:hypothetical protein